jgi:ADP-ribose pyrophosphatase
MKRSDLELPEARLELVEDLSPPDPGGFLRLVRRLWRVTASGVASDTFVYDEVDRRALDAVVLVAHFREAGVRRVYLRSVIRPPVAARDPKRSPVVERSRAGALWELPAGLVEPDEQGQSGLLRTAQRELAEELGFHVGTDQLIELGPSTFPTAGVIAERHFFFEVEVDAGLRQEPSLDGSVLESFGLVRHVPLADALALCRTGELEDAKTELGLRRLVERHGP